MKLQAIIATLIVVGGVGAGGYFVLQNDVSVQVNMAPEAAIDERQGADFRQRIPGYEELALKEKLREIRLIYDALEGDEKIAAARESERLSKELRAQAWENVGESDSPGVVPQGWED